MPKRSKAAASAKIEALVHRKEKRRNIPTRELAGFVAKEEAAPYIVQYPRDPALDPQLIWKGKDEQNSHDLAVPAVPIYIQEKIAPQALIEDLRLEQRRGQPVQQANLFGDFNGLDFEK